MRSFGSECQTNAGCHREEFPLSGDGLEAWGATGKLLTYNNAAHGAPHPALFGVASRGFPDGRKPNRPRHKGGMSRDLPITFCQTFRSRFEPLAGI
jgi:hypothetical protein